MFRLISTSLMNAIQYRTGAFYLNTSLIWFRFLSCSIFLAVSSLLIPHPLMAAQSAIASAHPLATAAGERILDQGGNACDAAVAVAVTLAVVEPFSSGLGGGGFLLWHRSSDRQQMMIDARETAPSGIRPQHFFDIDGSPIKDATVRGGAAVAIPGLPAGLARLSERCGSLPLGKTLASAIQLARDGFAVDSRYVNIVEMRQARLRQSEGGQRFLDRGQVPKVGFVLRQPDLANTLERIVEDGFKSAFYSGPIAQALVNTVNGAGGVWTMNDLVNYQAIDREPIVFTYRNARITSAALPSAGGIALFQALGVLEHFELGDAQNPQTAHLVVEALRYAFRDRWRLGDPDFGLPPISKDLEKIKLNQYVKNVSPDRVSALESLDESPISGGDHTTHFSVIDSAGNRVAATLTINLLFGSGLVGQGTGVLLNNEMDDFTLRGDIANSFKLKGGVANGVAPGKRPLSSMTPTFIEDEKGVLVLGAPGGSRIISQVLLASLNYIHNNEVDLRRMVSMPRYHHQFWPDRLELEPNGYSSEWVKKLEDKGHRVQFGVRPWGNLQAVFQSSKNANAQAASDPRGSGLAWY